MENVNSKSAEPLADLHIHSHYSDGTFSPEQIVQKAVEAGLKCIAVTDHDTIDGIEPTMALARSANLEVITGAEFSSQLQDKDVHVLGYLLNHRNKELLNELSSMQHFRVERIKKMIEKLSELGIKNISFEELATKVKSDAVGRPHLAALLLEKGCVKSIKEAFDKYLAEGSPAYVSKFKHTPFEVINIIKKAGGLAVLAHPMLTQIDELIPQLVKSGLDGLEIYYPNTPDPVVQFYKRMAQKNDLLETGGSDAHGDNKKFTFIGRVKIPYELVEKMKKRLGH